MENISLPLDCEQKNPPPRPTAASKHVRRIAAERAAEAIVNARWWEDEQWDSDLIDDLEDCLDEWDAYQMCRRLESRYYWQPDVVLVEILDEPWLSIAVSQAVKEWVKANGVKPKLAVGTVVRYGSKTGAITSLYEEDGCYGIKAEEGWTDLVPYESASVVSG